MAGLFRVLALTTLIFFIFGVVGVTLFSGALRWRCANPDGTINEVPLPCPLFLSPFSLCHAPWVTEFVRR